MAYTNPEVAERNTRQAYDDAQYSHWRWLIRFMLGGRATPHGSALSTSLTGELPDDIDQLPQYYEPGQSRRILTNESLMMAKVCYMEPDPDYPDKPREKEIITKAFDRALWQGRPHLGPSKAQEYGEMAPECHRAFMDFNGLGSGFVQIGVRDGWVCTQHHPRGRVIIDRHRLGYTRARHIAFVHHLSEEEAVSLFGSDIKKEVTQDEVKPNSLKVVKAIQYFDMGLGINEPTEIWRLGGLAGKVLDVGPNIYGCLPFAHGEHIHLPGMRHPAGRIDQQIADQVMRNAYERYQRLVLERGPPFDAYDLSTVDPEDQEALEGGELLPAIRFSLPPLGKIGDYIQRHPGHEVPATLFKGLEYLDRMDPGNSGISEADRANVTSSPRTLGELENVQAGADTQKEWSQRQYAHFLQRLFYKINYIAAKLHTAPTPVAYNGIPFLLNDPGVPQSNLEYWLTPQSHPVINEDLLSRQNPLRRMQTAQGKWLPIIENPVFAPIINLVEIFRELVGEGYGVKDVDRLLNPMALAAMQGQNPGMPPPPGQVMPGQMDPNQQALPPGQPTQQMPA